MGGYLVYGMERASMASNAIVLQMWLTKYAIGFFLPTPDSGAICQSVSKRV
jgi:hypothetical protein